MSWKRIATVLAACVLHCASARAQELVRFERARLFEDEGYLAVQAVERDFDRPRAVRILEWAAEGGRARVEFEAQGLTYRAVVPTSWLSEFRQDRATMRRASRDEVEARARPLTLVDDPRSRALSLLWGSEVRTAAAEVSFSGEVGPGQVRCADLLLVRFAEADGHAQGVFLRGTTTAETRVYDQDSRAPSPFLLPAGAMVQPRDLPPRAERRPGAPRSGPLVAADLINPARESASGFISRGAGEWQAVVGTSSRLPGELADPPVAELAPAPPALQGRAWRVARRTRLIGSEPARAWVVLPEPELTLRIEGVHPLDPGLVAVSETRDRRSWASRAVLRGSWLPLADLVPIESRGSEPTKAEPTKAGSTRGLVDALGPR